VARAFAFSDEKIFTCNDYTRRMHWVKQGKRALPRENARFPVRCMVWAVIAHNYIEYCILPNKKKADGDFDAFKLNSLTSEGYRRYVLPKVVPYLVRERLIFQQDGARAHTAGASMAYLRRKGVRVLEGWPPRSPDLNPIETLWAHMAPRVAAHFPLTHKELVSAIHCEFAKLKREDMPLVNHLVDSFPGRCRRVEAHGGSF
jgi:transposase